MTMGILGAAPCVRVKVDRAHLKEKWRLSQRVVAASQMFGGHPWSMSGAMVESVFSDCLG